MGLRILSRPWSELIGDSRDVAPGGPVIEVAPGDCAIVAANLEPMLHGERDGVSPMGGVARSTAGSSKRLYRIPLPTSPAEGCLLRLGEAAPIRIAWQEVPDRPDEETDSTDGKHQPGREIMDVVVRISARLKDIEHELDKATSPDQLWDELTNRWWSDDDKHRPTFDVIVKHARTLDRIVVEVLQHIRRVLVRTHRMTPVSRVQEIDRRSMLWLVRQPGRTIGERAGPSQRLLAPVRLQSVDTPENRVLHALAHQSRGVARSYCDRNRHARGSASVTAVKHYERVCRRIERTLNEKDVGLAAPGLPPNHALQHDVRYRRIWRAWQEILRRRRIHEEMWRWQARSWEELCVVVLVLACANLPRAKLVAGSPIHFHSEHVKGKWLLHDDPLAVFHLPDRRHMIEVTTCCREYPPEAPAPGVSAWLKISEYSGERSRWIAMWSLQSFSPASVDDELDGIEDSLHRLTDHLPMAGGIVLRSRLGSGKTNREAQREFSEQLLLALDLGLQPDEFASGLDELERHLRTSLEHATR